MNKPENHTVHGTIQSFNISPKGVFEGVLLKTEGGVVQVNFSPEAGAYISHHFKEGDKVAFKAEIVEKSDKGKADHKVYELVSFKDAHNNEIQLHHVHEPVSTAGKIIRLNYALHGEVNGAVLDNGDFVHCKPHGAKAANLSVGQKLEVEGEIRPSFHKHRVIEADCLNGVDLHEHKPKKKQA